MSTDLYVNDIAGLIKGASEGAGLGNAFLSHIQAVDGYYHVVRAFDNDEIVHVDDSVDPIRDLVRQLRRHSRTISRAFSQLYSTHACRTMCATLVLMLIGC